MARTATEINEAVHAAIKAYIEKARPDVGLVDLRSFVADTAGVNYAASTLARMLTGVGYVRDGVRKIDTCPGKATFYVPSRATLEAGRAHRDTGMKITGGLSGPFRRVR